MAGGGLRVCVVSLGDWEQLQLRVPEDPRGLSQPPSVQGPAAPSSDLFVTEGSSA